MTNVYLWHVERVFCGNPVFGVLQGENAEKSRLIGLVYAPDVEIDGHWFVRVTGDECPRMFDPIHDAVIGVTSHRERINAKLYEFARKYATRCAEIESCEFVDETLSGQSRSYDL